MQLFLTGKRYFDSVVLRGAQKINGFYSDGLCVKYRPYFDRYAKRLFDS